MRGSRLYQFAGYACLNSSREDITKKKVTASLRVAHVCCKSGNGKRETRHMSMIATPRGRPINSQDFCGAFGS
jgi:hypothetical protein